MWPDIVAADTATIFLLYLFVGALAYGYLESWNPEDTAYFTVVACTTVGYGDLVPVTTAGRLLTCVYVPVGIILVYRMMLPYAGIVIQTSESLVPFLANVPDTVTAEGDPNYGRESMRAALSPLLLLAVGVGVFHLFLDYTIVDAAYFAVISMTTVGFGDLAPVSLKGKAVAVVFMTLGSATIAAMIEQLYRIAQRRTIRNTPHEKLAAELLLQPSCWDTSFDGSHCYAARADSDGLSEAEFMLTVLVAHEVIDVGTLTALRRQYAHITRVSRGGNSKGGNGRGTGVAGDGSGKSGTDGDVTGPALYRQPRLDARLIFDQYVGEGRIRRRPADAAPGTALPAPEDPIVRTNLTDDKFATVDFDMPDGGFEEWTQHFWAARVAEARATHAAAATGNAPSDLAQQQQPDGVASRPQTARDVMV